MAGLKFNFVPLTVISSSEINNNFLVLNTWEVIGEDLSSQITGANLIFNFAYPYVSGTARIYVDGIRQKLTDNYLESGVQSISFLAGQAVSAGSDIVVDYRRSDL